MLLLTSAAAIVPAVAQQGQPNPNQAAAKAILQAADKAIGARYLPRAGGAIRVSSLPKATCHVRT
jgi:hypothetical protein